MNTDYNKLLYEKMQAENETFKDWLLSQEPAEILNHAYEYTMYQDMMLCIRLIKLPMKGTELDYANNLKKAFQSVHIFISSDTEEDVEIIKNTFERWRDSQ